MDQGTETKWREQSEHILSDIKEWRREHPKATLREIEEEVHQRMSRLEAQVVQDAAQESASREWSGTSGAQRPRCPVCQTPLQARGKRKRELQGVEGQNVTLTREYGTCPNCGTGVFPPG
jgi:uncharacterized protein with PIN domain